ncbi:hypothetical protein GCM10010399_31160 [Dactylosporangium fulvum]
MRFFTLRELGPGDRVTVTRSDATAREFVVVAREIHARSAILLDRCSARAGAPRNTLITCGGPANVRTRHYRGTVMITARPVGR